MAQELVVVLSCDVCGGREDVETFTIGGRAVDVCPRDDAGSVGDVVRLFDKHSRDVNAASRPRASGAILTRDPGALPALYRTCPKCGFVSRTRTATSQHVKAKHGTQLVEAERSAGRVFACVCGHEDLSFARVGFHVARTPPPGLHGFRP